MTTDAGASVACGILVTTKYFGGEVAKFTAWLDDQDPADIYSGELDLSNWNARLAAALQKKAKIEAPTIAHLIFVDRDACPGRIHFNGNWIFGEGLLVKPWEHTHKAYSESWKKHAQVYNWAWSG